MTSMTPPTSRKRKRRVCPSDVIACFYQAQEISAGLDQLSELVEGLPHNEKITLLLMPELLSRLSVCLYWMMHLRAILPFSSFLRGVSDIDITAMVQELLINTRTSASKKDSSVYDEVLSGILMHIFSDAGTAVAPVVFAAPKTPCADSYQQKCLHIIHQVCFPWSTATAYTAADSNDCFGQQQSLLSSPSQVLLRARDLNRLWHITTCISVCHDFAHVEAWQVLLLRSLFFCHVALDQSDDKANDEEEKGGPRDGGLLTPLNRLLETFPHHVATQALNSALQVQVDEQCSLHSYSHPSPGPFLCPSTQLLQQLETSSPFDEAALAAPPSGLCSSMLRLMLAPPAPSPTPFLKPSLVNESATASALLGIREQETVFFLRGLQLVVLAIAGAGAAREGQSRLCQWLRGIILGGQDSTTVTTTTTSSSPLLPASTSHLRPPLGTKELQFLYLTLCSSVGSFSEAVLRDLCAVLRTPAVRTLATADSNREVGEASDLFLQLSRARLRQLQDITVQLEGGAEGKIPASSSSLLHALTKGGRGGGGRKSAAIPEVTVARIQSWAATFNRTKELPVSVSQLCHMLAQQQGNGGGVGGDSLVLRSQSYRMLFSCMEQMIRDEQLTISTASSVASSSSKSSLLPLAEACRVVALGMTKCSPLLCPPSEYASFCERVERLTCPPGQLLQQEEERDGSRCSVRVGGRESQSMKEWVFSGVNHALPAASLTSPPQWQCKVSACRKAIEAALLIPSSLRQLIEAVDVPQHSNLPKEREGGLMPKEELFCGNHGAFSFAGFGCTTASVNENLTLSALASASYSSATKPVEEDWLSEEFLIGVRGRWQAACEEAALCCSSLHADVLKRFTGTVTLFVLQSYHQIYHKIAALYDIVKSLSVSADQVALVPSLAAMVVRLFRLGQILATIFSANNSNMLSTAVSIFRLGWSRKAGVSVEHTSPKVGAEAGCDLAEEGTNALFLLSLDDEARNLVMHAIVLELSHCRDKADSDVEAAAMTMSLRLLVQLHSMQQQCMVAAAPANDRAQKQSYPCTEASAFAQLPSVATAFLFLLSLQGPNWSLYYQSRLDGISLTREIYADMDEAISAASAASVNGKQTAMLSSVSAFLRSPESQRLFSWAYCCEARSGLGGLSRRERRALLSRLWCWLFLSRRKREVGFTSDVGREDDREGDDKGNFGDSLVSLLEGAMEMGEEVGRTHLALARGGWGMETVNGKVNGMSLSSPDMDFIETAVQVVSQACGRDLLLFPSEVSTLASLCSQWLQRVWTEAEGYGSDCGGEVAVKGGRRGESSSPLSITAATNSPLSGVSEQPPKGAVGWGWRMMSRQQQVQVACALEVVLLHERGAEKGLLLSSDKERCMGTKPAAAAAIPCELYTATFYKALQKN